MLDEAMRSTYDRIGGAIAIDRLVDLFYANMDSLPQAARIRAMHGEDLAEIRAVLKIYLAEWTGGPKAYSAEKGHPRLRQRHLPFAIGAAERDAWLACMRGALDASIADAVVREEVYAAMAKLADWMRNQPGNPHDLKSAHSGTPK